MSLTDTAIKAFKPNDKPYKIADGHGVGLYLLINKTGKYFRMDYRFQGKRKTLSFGKYPDISLRDARQKAIDAHIKIKTGIDPAPNKNHATLNQFESVAREWFEKQKTIWKESHSAKIIRRLETNIFPYIGKHDISEIDAPALLVVLKRIEDKGTIETAHRVKQVLGQIFRYAIITGRARHDPSADLKGALTPYRSRNMATITDTDKIGELLRAIDKYSGSFVVQCALKFAPLTFVRPGELRHAEWIEIDIDKAIWKIPAEKMKMGRVHIVPLSKQAVKILNDLKPLTGHGRYVFPSIRTTVRPMSENTVNAALRMLGYEKSVMCGHGFRSMASTLLHENNWNSDIIELQLAHVETNSVKGAYNHAQHLPERVKMMQWYSDLLDYLKFVH